jgi:hypothetical protein
MKFATRVTIVLACPALLMTLLIASAILSRGPHIIGAWYDGRAEGCGLVQLSRDQLHGAPSTFLYRWTPAGSRTETNAMLKRVAVIRGCGAERFEPHWSSSTAAEFPVFDDASAFHQKVSSILSDNARTFVAENSGEHTWHDWLGIFHRGDFDHYEDLSVELCAVEKDLVSVELEEGCFPTRGGDYDIYVYNFVNDNGRARSLALADLFLPNSGWEKKLSDFCLAEFRARGATHVADGSITSFGPENFALFNVTRSALQIHFGCLWVTDDGGGDCRVDIPWSELRRYLRPEGPARFLMSPTNKPRPQRRGDRPPADKRSFK